MNNKQKYIEFCKNEKVMPIFSKPFWLDAVCGEDGWDVILVEKGGKIFASMPYVKPIVRYSLTYSTMPKLTQTLGPYISYPKGQKYVKRLAFEKEIINLLIEKIPFCDYFSQNFDYNYKNWLPFYWNKYQQTTRYTYILNDLIDYENVYNGFQSNIKTDIKKAQKVLKVNFKEELKIIYNTVEKTFIRQSKKIPFDFSYFENIDKALLKNANRLSLSAVDEIGNVHAVVYIIYNENEAYYLLGGGDPKYRNSGAHSFLINEALKLLTTKTKIFNFEGSMIEPVERFFRAFGAIQKPYFQITKLSRKAKILYGLKNLANDIIKG